MKREDRAETNQSLERRLLERLLQERERWGLSARTSQEIAVVWTGKKQHRCKTVLIFESAKRHPVLVVKLSRGPVTARLLEMEARNLERLQSFPRRGIVPKLVGRLDLEGIFCLAREYLVGVTWDRLLAHAKPSQRPRLVAQLAERLAPRLLAWLKPAEPLSFPLEAGAAVRRRLSEYQETLLEGPLERTGIERAFQALAQTQETLSWIPWQNGDLTLSNLLSLPEGGLAVIDWEHAQSPGLPLVDAIMFGMNLECFLRGSQARFDSLEPMIRPWLGEVQSATHLTGEGAGALAVYSFVDLMLREFELNSHDPTVRDLRSHFRAFLQKERFGGLPR